MRSMQSRGSIPKRAMSPVCGIRYGMDISTANSSTSPHNSMFSLFISGVYLTSHKDMNYFTTFVGYVDRYV